jgi:tRNA dimethylallyltransferase
LSKKLILIAGPTASGKSNLALNLAKKIGGEIINADSMQVYKEFLILSSRPPEKDFEKVKHYLYGFISAKKYFSTGEWLKQVKIQINKCVKNKKIPILVGGTGLYFNAITRGMSKIPKIDNKTKNLVRNLHKKIGAKKFYSKLVLIDPSVKNKILATDTQRVIRAYEVKIKTNKSLYEWAKNTKSDFTNFKIKKIFIDIPKEELLKKIKKRIDMMFKQNCIEEVNLFSKLKIDKSLSANKLIGVKEITDYSKKLITLDQAKKLINIKTRQYAKRQNTWSRGHMKSWKKLYSKDISSLLKKTLKEIS